MTNHLHAGAHLSKATPLCGATDGMVVGELIPGDCEDCQRIVATCDHADRCCVIHGTHTLPHKGCILR